MFKSICFFAGILFLVLLTQFVEAAPVLSLLTP